jgi:hypothetical protein
LVALDRAAAYARTVPELRFEMSVGYSEIEE